MNTAAFPAPRIVPNAAHAFGGIWRLAARRFFTPGYWLMLAGMLVLLVVFSIPAAPNQAAAQQGLLQWAAGFYVCFLLPLLAFISAGGAIRDDLGAGTVDYVFTRPVRRSAFIVFRYLAQMACTQIDFVFALGTVVGLGLFWDVPDLWDAVPLLLLAQVAGIVVFSAVGFLAGLVTSRYIIIGLAYGGIVEVGLGSVPTQLNQISLVRQLLALVRPLLGEGGWAVTQTAFTSSHSMPFTLIVLTAVASVAIALAAILFSFREFSGAGARDNG